MDQSNLLQTCRLNTTSPFSEHLVCMGGELSRLSSVQVLLRRGDLRNVGTQSKDAWIFHGMVHGLSLRPTRIACSGRIPTKFEQSSQRMQDVPTTRVHSTHLQLQA